MTPLRTARRIPGLLVRLGEPVRAFFGAPRRALAAALASVLAAATIVVRRRRKAPLALPDPGPLAAEAAVSVHNAAKGAVISAVRVAPDVGMDDLRAIVRDAMVDAMHAGVDVIAAAIGVVEGAEQVAHLVSDPPEEVLRAAAKIATVVAGEQGPTAGERVAEVLVSVS